METLKIFKFKNANLLLFGKFIGSLGIVGGMLLGCSEESLPETDSQLYTQVAIWGTISDGDNGDDNGGGYGKVLEVKKILLHLTALMGSLMMLMIIFTQQNFKIIEYKNSLQMENC